jgi:hypothetical protein
MRLKERKGGKSLFIVHLRDLSGGGEERRIFGEEARARGVHLEKGTEGYT